MAYLGQNVTLAGPLVAWLKKPISKNMLVKVSSSSPNFRVDPSGKPCKPCDAHKGWSPTPGEASRINGTWKGKYGKYTICMFISMFITHYSSRCPAHLGSTIRHCPFNPLAMPLACSTASVAAACRLHGPTSSTGWGSGIGIVLFTFPVVWESTFWN